MLHFDNAYGPTGSLKVKCLPSGPFLFYFLGMQMAVWTHCVLFSFLSIPCKVINVLSSFD